jgi:hypothetical protein
MTMMSVREHLTDLQEMNRDDSAELADLLVAAVQVNLAVTAVRELTAAGYPAFLRLYGGHAMACIDLPEGRTLALDPMGRCHWSPMEECLGVDGYEDFEADPETWDVVAYDADGEMLDFC